jgi:hypothetical protein
VDQQGAMKYAIKLIMRDTARKKGCSVVVKNAMVGSMYSLFRGSGKLHADVPAGELSDMVKERFAMTVVVNELTNLPGMKTDWFSQFEMLAKIRIKQSASRHPPRPTYTSHALCVCFFNTPASFKRCKIYGTV